MFPQERSPCAHTMVDAIEHQSSGKKSNCVRSIGQDKDGKQMRPYHIDDCICACDYYTAGNKHVTELGR